jgi:hypothetical protein
MLGPESVKYRGFEATLGKAERLLLLLHVGHGLHAVHRGCTCEVTFVYLLLKIKETSEKEISDNKFLQPKAAQ